MPKSSMLKPPPIETISGAINRLSDVVDQLAVTLNRLNQTNKQTLRNQIGVQASVAMFQEIRDIVDIIEWNRQRDGGVFISYSHADKEFVNSLSKRLKRDSINIWLDEKILVGEVIDKAISNAIQKSRFFIIILSPTSIKSKWVERELDEASHEEIEGKKIILPVIVKGLKVNKLPPRLRRKLFVDFTNNFDDGYKKLKKSVLAYMMESSKTKK